MAESADFHIAVVRQQFRDSGERRLRPDYRPASLFQQEATPSVQGAVAGYRCVRTQTLGPRFALVSRQSFIALHGS